MLQLFHKVFWQNNEIYGEFLSSLCWLFKYMKIWSRSFPVPYSSVPRVFLLVEKLGKYFLTIFRNTAKTAEETTSGLTHYRTMFPLYRNYASDLQYMVWYTVQKMKFSIREFFSKCDQIRCKLRIWSHLLKKSWTENFIFCAVIERKLLITGQTFFFRWGEKEGS